MQALIVGGGNEEDAIFNTQYIPSPKDLFTIAPALVGVTSVFNIVGAPILTAELWGGGGASGSARDGISGAGGAGGYVKALINASVNVPGVRIQVGGGGGAGIPEYYAIPSDEYTTQNVGDIVSVGTASANSQVSLTTPFEVVDSRRTVSATEGTNPAVSYVSSSSGSNVIELTTTSVQGDIILLASSCDQGDILLPNGFSVISNNGAGSPSYRLSYKYVATDNEVISGLQPSITFNGVARTVSHVAQIFRGVNPTPSQGVISQGLQTSPGQPTLPNATSNLTGCMLASFGFFDNVALAPTSITAPTGHINLISASLNSASTITPVTTLTGNTFVATLTTDTSFTVDGLTPGDFVIVVAGSDGQTPATPDGWQSLTSGGPNPGRRVAYTFATGTSITLSVLSDPSNDPLADPDPILDRNIAYTVLAFRGVDPDAPINISANDTNVSANPDPPTVTTTVDGCMIVALGVLDDDSEAPSVAPPLGYTLGPVAATGTTGDGTNAATVMTAYLLQTTAGTATPGPFLSDGNDQWSAHTLALSPLRIDSTVMAANRELPIANTYNNGSFGITGASEASVGTSILLVRNNNIIPSPSTMSIPGLSSGDIIIVASVADAGTPLLPSTGFADISPAGVGYRLSWKRVTDVVADATITNLSTVGQDNNGNSALIRHVAYVYRSVSDLNPIISSTANGTGTIISPSDILAPVDESLSSYACIPFVFIRNVSLTASNITASDLNYTLGTVYPVGTNSTGISEATLVNAFRSGLTDVTTETPTDFAITQSVNWSSITVGLKPSATAAAFTGSIALPVTTQVGDLVLCASVSDDGTLATPSGSGLSYQSIANNNGSTPSYQLSYKFITSALETTVDGLTGTTFTGGGDPRGTAHTVQVFRGVNPSIPITFSVGNGNNNQPNSPNIGGVSVNNTVVSFAFVDDRSVSVTGTPAGYVLGPVASVGTNPNSVTEATVLSAYNSTPTSPDEDPGGFTISNGDNWDAITILLQNNVTQRFYNFPLNPGGCGGSSGGYTAIFIFGGPRDGDLILMVGGGGGGGGSSIIPAGSTIFTPQYEASRSVGGSGGVGGGNGGNGFPGSNGNSFFATGGSYSRAGLGGAGGLSLSGGLGGESVQNLTVIPVLNPGEAGVAYTVTSIGGRGANSPYNTSDIPLQGANATGGYIAGRGGGASRTQSTQFDAPIASDCGGAGGAGYFGGGGGGPGLYGGGGGGGGGSAYYDPTIVTIISTEVGVGTNPAGRSSEFWSFPIAVGGSAAVGNLTSGVPATTTSIGSTGGDGRAVVTFFTV